MSAPHMCLGEPCISPKNADWRLSNCCLDYTRMKKYTTDGVCIDHLPQELRGWGYLQGLGSLKKKLEFFKTIPYHNFTQGVKQGIREGQAEVEKMMSSVQHMLSQIEQEIFHLEKSVDHDVVKSILAKHQANPQPDFTDVESLIEHIKVLPPVERVKRRSEVRDFITRTLIARKTWEGEGYLPHILTCETDVLCGRFCD
jgi:hypothetical protein